MVEGSHILAKLFVGNGNNFERMQYHLVLLDPEAWVEARIADLAEHGLVDQRHYDPTPVAVVYRLLNQNYIGNIVPMLSRIPMHIELSHLVRSEG